MRINKFLTDRGYCSRREADRLIEAKRVQINGRVAVLGDQVLIENKDGAADRVSVDGVEISAAADKVYIMYNKPRGITCTSEPNVTDNIIQAVRHSQRVFPIGRLDKDSTGLIFLTNDGDIVNKILRAQFGHEKEYVVEINRPADDGFLAKMAKGVDIGGYVTQPCPVKKMGGNTFSIILTEGKNRQIRRMCEALGAVVKNLRRIRIMNVKIGSLKEGSWRDIPVEELKSLKAALDRAPSSTSKEEDSKDSEE